MFGYVIPLKGELKVSEYNVYKAVYCSLCRALDNNYGPFSKFALSYDFAFMAMLGLATAPDTNIEFEQRRCRANPLKRQSYIVAGDGDALDYSAACLALSVKYKLKDTMQDEGLLRKIGAAFAYPFLAGGFKKAARRYPETADAIANSIEAQHSLEQARCDKIDLAADPTAAALGFMFERLGHDEPTARILQRLGYLIGRFVYLADAGDDLKSDLKKKRYNPLAEKHGIESDKDEAAINSAIDELRPELLNTRGEIALCYNLLDIQNFKPILDNIIFLGFNGVIERVGAEPKGTEHAGSL